MAVQGGHSGRVQYHAMTDVRALTALCTCPDRDTARTLARAAVSAGLAACVNIVEGVVSVYAWQGEINEDAELLLVAKTTESAYPELERLWQGQHPYELPEIIAVPISTGLDAYLAWIRDACA